MQVRKLQTLYVLRFLVFCNVLHIIYNYDVRAIPTYRVYRLYDKVQPDLSQICATEKPPHKI